MTVPEPNQINSDIDSALLASFEGHGRRGWLHTEIDRWLWDGKDRKPADSRRLIEDNREEFHRYGELVAPEATNSGRPGRPAIAYLLNFGHALLYCTLSEAPRAADVREALIRTFQKHTTGELVPVSSDAVIQSTRWDRMTEAITALAVTVDRGFQTVGTEIGELRGAITAQGDRIDGLSERVDRMEARKRRDPHPNDIALFVRVVDEDYRGKCPCCEENVIVDGAGNRTELWTIDHTNGPWDNRPEHEWPACRPCNQRLFGEIGYRKQMQSEFAVFQKRYAKRRPAQMLLLT